MNSVGANFDRRWGECFGVCEAVDVVFVDVTCSYSKYELVLSVEIDEDDKNKTKLRKKTKRKEVTDGSLNMR